MPDPAPLRVFGIAGSLRAASYNRALLRACVELAPAGMEIRVFERLREIPPYDADVDAAGAPEPVRALKDAIAAADALLFVTPEYNYGVPGVLKNAIDWASRPSATTPLRGKPALVMGAATGRSGTIRAQLQLRQAFVYVQVHALPAPEVVVQFAAEKFADGRLADEATRTLVAERLAALADWTRRLAPRG